MTAPGVSCPYVGLQPFEPEHADYFFGRERDQRIIIANLLAAPLTILYGSSGVGKSSLLNAGVTPQLRRDRPNTPVVVFREWARPDFHTALARRCIEAVWNGNPNQPKPAETLAFHDLLRACAEAARETMLILFDQFEEYFLYHPKSSAPDSFEADFARAVNRDDVDVGFLLALREDGLAKLDRFQERIPNLLSNRLRLKHLDEAGAKLAIRRPLKVWNKKAAPGSEPIVIEDRLVDLLIDQIQVGRVSVVRQAGSGSGQKQERLIEAPFLQLVMERLWAEEAAKGSRLLRAATLEELGGAQAIVGRHLDEVMARLDATGQAVCASVFDRLVTPTGGKIACSREALAGWATAALAPEVPAVLDALCRERILRATESAEDRETTSYEVFHDVLAPAILDWRARYIGAQEQEEAVRREREEVSRRAEHERDQLKRRAQLRLLIASAILTLIAISGWFYSFIEGTRAAANGKGAEAILAASRNEPSQALDLALEAIDETTRYGFSPTQTAEDALRQSLRILPNREQIMRVPDQVWDVAFSPDGRLAATGGKDNTVRLWDVTAGELRPLPVEFAHPQDVRELAFLPDGRLLTIAGSEMQLFDIHQPDASPRIFEHGSPIYHALAVSADGRRAATAGWGGEGQPAFIKVWDLETTDSPPVPISEIDVGSVWIMGLAFSPDGCCLATAMVVRGSPDRTFTEIWSLDSRQRILEVPNLADSDAIAFTPDGEALITAGRDSRVRVFRPSRGNLAKLLADRAAGETQPASVAVVGNAPLPLTAPPAIPWDTMVLAGHTDRVRDVAVSRDGTRIASGSADGTVRIWDVASGQNLFTLRGHQHFVEAVDFSPDGRYLITGSRDRTVRLWDVGRHAGSVNSIAFASDGNAVATGSADGTAKIWDVTGDEPKLQQTLRGHKHEVYRLAFDPSGQRLATAGFDGKARVWERATGRELAVLADHTDQLRDIAFSGDGRLLATAGADGKVFVYDLSTLPAAAPFSLVHKSKDVQVLSVAFSPREGLIATAGMNDVIRFWGEQGEDRGSIVRKGLTAFRQVVFSPDGSELAALGINHVYLWPKESFGVADAPPRLVINLAPSRLCMTIAYSRDGERLAAACRDSSVPIFDLRTGQRVQTITAHDGSVNQAAFSPDGIRLATAGGDRSFLVAPLDFRALRALAERLRETAAAKAKAAVAE